MENGNHEEGSKQWLGLNLGGGEGSDWMKNEGVCSGFDLSLVGVENEERRGLFLGFDLGLLIWRMKNKGRKVGLLIWRMKNEGRKGGTTKEEKEQWVNKKGNRVCKTWFSLPALWSRDSYAWVATVNSSLRSSRC